MSNMQSKPFYTSRTVWFNIIYTVGEVAAFALDLLPERWLPYAVVAQGVVNIILRIWFTSTPVTLRNSD